MLAQSLQRRQAGEAGPVGGRLVDGSGDALRQRAHVLERRCNIAATDRYWSPRKRWTAPAYAPLRLLTLPETAAYLCVKLYTRPRELKIQGKSPCLLTPLRTILCFLMP